MWTSPERGLGFDPVRDVLGAIDGLDAREGESEAETEARRPVVREKDQERARALRDQAERLDEAEWRRRAALVPNANPITHYAPVDNESPRYRLPRTPWFGLIPLHLAAARGHREQARDPE